jgi:hypothetical protein
LQQRVLFPRSSHPVFARARRVFTTPAFCGHARPLAFLTLAAGMRYLAVPLRHWMRGLETALGVYRLPEPVPVRLPGRARFVVLRPASAEEGQGFIRGPPGRTAGRTAADAQPFLRAFHTA